MSGIPNGEDAAPVDPTLFSYLVFEDDEEDEDEGE
jgi:hypothetical protein